MHTIETHINEDGINFIDRVSRNMRILDLDNDGNQVYIPGLSFPEHPILRDGFNFPIIGDEEPYEVSTTWLQGIPIASEGQLKIVQFAGVLPAEEITVGEPFERDVFYFPNEDEIEADEAFDELTGYFGGLLYVQLSYLEEQAPAGNVYTVILGDAEFLVFDNMSELNQLCTDTAINMSFIGAVNIARNKLKQQN